MLHSSSGTAGRLHRYVAALRDSGLSIRAYFSAVVIVILIPALLFGGWLASLSAAAKREQIEQNAQRKVREIAVVIDREILGTMNMLTALASSHFLHVGDFEKFHHQVMEVSRQLNLQIVLRDPQRNAHIVNTAVAWGTPLPRGPAPAAVNEMEQEALRSGKPGTSSLFSGRLTRHYIIAVGVPVILDSTAAYVLGASIPAGRLEAILHGAQLAPHETVTISDRNETVIARSHKHDEFVGMPLPLNADRQASSAEGVVTGTNLEGIATRWYYQRSAATGWLISVGVPTGVIDTPARLTLASFAAAGCLILVFAGVVTYHMGGRLSAAIGTLRTAAFALRNSEIVTPVVTPLRETNEVSDALSTASAAWRTIQDQNRFAIDAAEIGTWHWNVVTGERFWSDRFKELIGVPLTTKPSRTTFLGRIHPSDLRTFEDIRDRSIAEKGQYEIEFRVVGSNDGPPRWLSTKGHVDYDGIGRAVRMQGVIQDISARKELEHQRDDMRRRLMQAQEQERLRLARDLHDQTGQGLAAVMLELKSFEAQLDDEACGRLRPLRGQLEQMGKTLHRVAWELRPTAIEDLGLTAALENHLSDWSARFGVDVDFQNGDARLDQLTDEVRTTIYRVVQEALTNIAKHARGVTVVSVVIDRLKDSLRVTIDDNGCGFHDPSMTGLSNECLRVGLGLAGMRERLSLIGGALEVESSIGSGTTLFVRIPLNAEG